MKTETDMMLCPSAVECLDTALAFSGMAFACYGLISGNSWPWPLVAMINAADAVLLRRTRSLAALPDQHGSEVAGRTNGPKESRDEK